MDLALARFDNLDILHRILAASPDPEVFNFFIPDQLIAQLKAWIPVTPKPDGRNDRIRILAGAFSVLESRPGFIKAVIRQGDTGYLYRLASRLDLGDAVDDDEVAMVELEQG